MPYISDTNTITLETTITVCKKAVAAYQAATAGKGSVYSAAIYVVNFGASGVDLVWDPGFYLGGPNNPRGPKFAYAVFDSRWALKSLF